MPRIRRRAGAKEAEHERTTQSPASPTEQTQITDEVRQQIIGRIGQYLSGYHQRFAASGIPVGADTIVPMQPGHDHRFIMDLVGGANYGFIGACDDDCSNVDIEVIDMNTGGVVANDMLPDDFPLASLRPEANGRYMVRLLLQACTKSPCYAGVRVVTDQPQAAQQQAPAPQGAPADAPRPSGGTPGKP